MISRQLIIGFLAGTCPALLPLPALAMGDGSSGVSEDYFFGEIPVVLSASRLAQPISESPAAMTIIDRDMIEASGAINIPDVLRLAPGFQVSHISGQNLTAQYHGIANQHPKRMQILIDGRSVYHSAFGGVHWDTLPITLDDIERIEVLRGSNAATYGSNAFMGVVNIITRHASLDQGSQVSLLNGYSGTREAEWRFGDRLGDLDYRFTVSGFETDGFPNHVNHHTYWDSTGGPVSPASVITTTPLQSEKTLYKLAREDSQSIGRFNLRGDYLVDNGDILLFELGYVRNDRDNTLDNGSYDLLRPDENLRASSQLLKWSREMPDIGEISFQLTHNRFDLDSTHTDILIERSGTPVDQGGTGFLINAGPTLGGQKFRNDRYDIELQLTPDEWNGWRTVWGGGLRVDKLDGYNFSIDNRDLERRQYRLFGNVEKHFGARQQWVFNAGLMLEHQQDSGNYASPRVALNYHVDGFNTLRVAASRAYRMPSFYEQYGETNIVLLDPSSINPLLTSPLNYLNYSNRTSNIKPERLDSIEFGLVSANWIDGMTFDIRVFREKLRNYIDQVLNQNACSGCDGVSLDPILGPLGYNPHDLWIMENAGWMNIKGAELQLKFLPSDRTTLHTSASVARTEGERIRKRNTAGNVTSIQDISDFVPKLTLSGILSHRFDHNWSGSLSYYRMTGMNWPNDGDRLPPYDRLDLRLAKKFRFASNRGQLELIAQNARNQAYIEFRDDNKFEHRLYLRLKIETD